MGLTDSLLSVYLRFIWKNNNKAKLTVNYIQWHSFLYMSLLINLDKIIIHYCAKFQKSSPSESHFEIDIQGRQSLTGVITKSISMVVLLYQLFTIFWDLMWKWLSYKTFVTRTIIFNWNVNLLTVPNYELIYRYFQNQFVKFSYWHNLIIFSKKWPL